MAVQGKIDFDALRASPFWNKKFDHATKFLDYRKSGFVRHSDFQNIVQRYKELGNPTPEQLTALSESFKRSCKQMGLSEDDSNKFTYDEFKNKWFDTMKFLQEKGFLGSYFNLTYDILDGDKDNNVTLDDWTLHHRAQGIHEDHAKVSYGHASQSTKGLSRDELAAYYKEFFFSTEDKLNSSVLFGPLPE